MSGAGADCMRKRVLPRGTLCFRRGNTIVYMRVMPASWETGLIEVQVSLCQRQPRRGYEEDQVAGDLYAAKVPAVRGGFDGALEVYGLANAVASTVRTIRTTRGYQPVAGAREPQYGKDGPRCERLP